MPKLFAKKISLMLWIEIAFDEKIVYQQGLRCYEKMWCRSKN